MKVVATPTWLVTYADLLTLLVCFFVTLLSKGMLNPRQAIQPLPAISSNTKDLAIVKTDLARGTELASQISSLELQLLFSSADFAKNGLTVESKGKFNLWIDKLNSGAVSEVVVESCDKDDARLNKTLWRAMLISDLLLKHKHLADKLFVELRNAGCSGNPSSLQITAR